MSSALGTWRRAGHRDLPMIARQLSPLLNVLPGERVGLDMSQLGFVAPCGMAMIRAAWISAMERGVAPADIEVLPPDAKVSTYLDRMDLFPPECAFPRYTGPRNEPKFFWPVTEFRDHMEAAEIALYLGEHGGAALTEADRKIIGSVAGELADNCVIHAEGWGGVACAQRWTGGATQFALVDTGRGVIQSFRDAGRYADVSDREIIMRLCSEHFTSTGDAGRGLGLNKIASYADRTGGSLSILTGSWLYTRNRGKLPEVSETPHYWPGTTVVWEVPTVTALETLYNSM